ncbi:MAG: serine protease Do [Verrucomicrobiales bacterium]|jgi:serine protease Do
MESVLCDWGNCQRLAMLMVAVLLLLCSSNLSAQEVGREAIPVSRVPQPDKSQLAAAEVPVDSLHPFERLNGSLVTGVFAKAIAGGTRSIIPLESANGKLIALSVAVSSNGFLVSKASELEGVESGKLVARIPGIGLVQAEMVQMQKTNDLALVRVEADVVPIEWAASTALKTGYLVGAVATGSNGVRVGIVSAEFRRIDREGGVIGVRLDPREGAGKDYGVLISRVYEGSGASDAEIKSGDIILSVAGKVVNSREEVTEIVTNYDVGESVDIVIERRADGKEQNEVMEVILGYRREILDRHDRNQVLSGASSNRRAGFENVIQHDIPLGPEAMGGVLFTVDGKAVGINIARRDRVTTFALPSEIVQRVARDMIVVEMGDARDRAQSEEAVEH